MKHYLKIGEQYAREVFSGRKRAEIRYNDRNYMLGDEIVFVDYKDHILPCKNHYFICHVLDNFTVGLRDNYVMLSLTAIEKK
jgi:ASC-1-like (ASCH) protein